MTKSLNLPQEYFHCPELSKREKLYLIQKAQDSARALVESARSSHGPVRWIEAGTHKGVQMYKGEGRHPTGTTTEQIQYVCGATTIQATIEEVAAFMDVSTTPKFKAYVPHQHELLDGVVLYTLVPPAPENQFLHQVTIKWSAAHVPSTLIKDRDFLTLECQDVFTDTTGRRGWVRSYHSVKLPCCPDLQAELGFVRGSFYHTGYVFVESERAGWLDCIHTCQVNLKGNLRLPSSIYFLAMRRRIGSVAALGKALQQRRLGKQTFLSDLELVPKSKRSRCHVCAAKFGLITRKSRCRKCGEVVCGQCTQTWEVSLPKSGVKKVRVCATCACSGDTTMVPSQMTDELSLVSSASHDSEQYSPDYEYHDHEPQQLPLQLKSTIMEEPEHHSYDSYGPSAAAPPPPPPPGPQLGSQSVLGRPHSYSTHPPVNHPGRRAPLPYDQDPFRPIGFVHQSEYDRPRFEHAPPPRGGPAYPGDYRASYRDEYGRAYGMPPSHGPRHHSEYHHYPDEYGYYPPPPPPHGHGYGPPSRRYVSETIPHSGPMGGKPYPTDETVTSSTDRSLTAHALERHTREMGRPGPVAPHAYDYDRPMGPPATQRITYHGPPHPHDYPPHAPPHYRDERTSMHSMHSAPYDHHSMPRPSGSDRGYADDMANLRSSMFSNHSYRSEHEADPHRHSLSQQQQRTSPVPPTTLPLQEQVVPENELYKSRGPQNNHTDQQADPPAEQQATSTSRSTSPDQEAALALAADATRLMQQQQEIQEQLQARALSFSSDHRYTFDNDDEDDDDDQGENGLEDWSTSAPSTRSMLLNEFKSLEINEPQTSTPDAKIPVVRTSLSAVETMSSTRRSAVASEIHGSTSNQPKATTLAGVDLTKLTVVQLYQKILELTKTQHSLEADANALTAEKDAVANDLKALYKQLNEINNENEVAF